MSLLTASAACSQGPTELVTAPCGVLTPSAPLLVARALHTATLLPDGRVLVVGGGTPEVPIASAEILDPAAGTSTLIPMSIGRLGHTASLLASGKVVVVGGGYGAGAPAARTAELFDPTTAGFRPTGSPVEPRADHAAVRLLSGKILVVGGDVSGVGSTPTASAEVFDPATESFAMTGAMQTPRRPYGVVVMPDGSVLVPGGTSTGKRIIAETELYDVTAGQFRRAGTLAGAREKHTAAVLRSGNVLVVGGSDGQSDADLLSSTEVFDPRTGASAKGPSLNAARHKIASVTLPDGKVVVVGGGSSLVEVFDPEANRFCPVTGAAGIERFFAAATLLSDGRVLVSGGYTSGGSRTNTWIFSTIR